MMPLTVEHVPSRAAASPDGVCLFEWSHAQALPIDVCVPADLSRPQTPIQLKPHGQQWAGQGAACRDLRVPFKMTGNNSAQRDIQGRGVL